MKLLSLVWFLALASTLSYPSILTSAQTELIQLINLSVFSTPSCRGVQLVYLDIPPGECLTSFDDPFWGRSINVWGAAIDDGRDWGYVTGWKNEDCTVEQYQHRPTSNSGACLADIQEEKRAVSYSWTYTGPLTLDTLETKKDCIGPDFLQYFDEELGVSRRIPVQGLEHGELEDFARHLAQLEKDKEFSELEKYIEGGYRSRLLLKLLSLTCNPLVSLMFERRSVVFHLCCVCSRAVFPRLPYLSVQYSLIEQSVADCITFW
jgi:hypothetical protein